MVELLYALNASNQMVHVSSVPNGIACNCVCPCCNAPLVAKNQGETMSPHFAHASGQTCSGAHESELHMLAKEIISNANTVMLPRYGNVYPGGQVHFDEVEVEKRNDISILQPDLCGVIKHDDNESRLWIEIMVTHAVGAEKRELIRRNKIACVEINLSAYIDRQVTKEELSVFLLTDKTSREWVNNPKLEEKRMKMASEWRQYVAETVMRNEEQGDMDRIKYDYLEHHRDCWIVPYKSCFKCKHHTTRNALLENAKRQRLPSWMKEALSGNLLYYTRDNIRDTIVDNNGYVIRFDNYLHNLPTSSPDILGRPVSPGEIRQNARAISFLLDTVPEIIANEGLKCGHCQRIFNISPTKREVACNKSNIVNRHRR